MPTEHLQPVEGQEIESNDSRSFVGALAISASAAAGGVFVQEVLTDHNILAGTGTVLAVGMGYLALEAVFAKHRQSKSS